jgi:TFIIF-interacting CTD phosphatase-like protein
LPALDANKQTKIVGEVSRVAGSLFSPVLQEDGSHKKENEINEEIVNPTTNVMDEENGEDDDDDDIFNPYLFMATLPPHASVAVKGKICLPPQIRVKPTLVLDLDETLVHCSVNPFLNPDLTFPVTFKGTHYRVYVRKRPFLDYFLETVSKHFEV